MTVAHTVTLQRICGHLAVQSSAAGKTVSQQERLACSSAARTVELQKNCGHLAVQSSTAGKTVPQQERLACSRLLLAGNEVLGALFRSAPLHNDPPPYSQPLRMCKAMLAEAMEDCGRGEGSDQNQVEEVTPVQSLRA